MAVRCDPDSNVILRGNPEITCQEGTLYAFNEKPRCDDAGRNRLNSLYIDIVKEV